VIKVNLLATSPGQAPPREWFPREQRAALAGFVLLVVTASVTAGWWFYLDRTRASVNARISADNAELTQLKDASKLVDAATARRTELAERLGLIDRLQAAKRIPVTLLETVSKSIPDGLWLLNLNQKGDAISVEGRAMSITAVTDFAERLQNSGVFEHPVDITTTTDTVETENVVHFTVKASTVNKDTNPGDPGDTPAAAPKPGAKPAPAPAASTRKGT
jgi:type IV pilus assembly protein PilN